MSWEGSANPEVPGSPASFDLHRQAHRDAGLRLVKVWRGVDEPDNVIFMLDGGVTAHCG